MKSIKIVIFQAFLRGFSAALLLVGFYLVLVGVVSQSWVHSWELLGQDRFYVGAIASGFGIQVGLYSYLRRIQRLLQTRGASAMTAAGTGSSTAAMVACCLHHFTDVLPIIGISGAAVFLEQLRYPVMGVGIAVNGVGIWLMLRVLFKNNLWPSQLKGGNLECCNIPAGDSN